MIWSRAIKASMSRHGESSSSSNLCEYLQRINSKLFRYGTTGAEKLRAAAMNTACLRNTIMIPNRACSQCGAVAKSVIQFHIMQSPFRAVR